MPDKLGNEKAGGKAFVGKACLSIAPFCSRGFVVLLLHACSGDKVMRELYHDAQRLRRYAQQEPELPGTSTVWEFLRFHARLRMPQEHRTNNAAEARVWGVISQLGLNKVSQHAHTQTSVHLSMCLYVHVCG